MRGEGDVTLVEVEEGGCPVFPFGPAHSIGDELSSPLTRTVQLAYDASREYQIFPFEGEGQKMVMLCGAFHFESPGDYPLLQCLPKVIHIPGEQGRMAQSFSEIVRFIARESAEHLPGTVVFLRRLTELLFILVIRVGITQ